MLSSLCEGFVSVSVAPVCGQQTLPLPEPLSNLNQKRGRWQDLRCLPQYLLSLRRAAEMLRLSVCQPVCGALAHHVLVLGLLCWLECPPCYASVASQRVTAGQPAKPEGQVQRAVLKPQAAVQNKRKEGGREWWHAAKQYKFAPPHLVCFHGNTITSFICLLFFFFFPWSSSRELVVVLVLVGDASGCLSVQQFAKEKKAHNVQRYAMCC